MDASVVGPQTFRAATEAARKLGTSSQDAATRLRAYAEAAAALSDDELVATLKGLDREIAGIDALRDQDMLLELLRLESDPSPLRRELKRVRKLKEAAILVQDFELASDYRDRERSLAGRIRRDADQDCIARLRFNGLVVEDILGAPPRLTDAGRRLASSLL